MADRAVFSFKIVDGNNKGKDIQLTGDVISLGSGNAFSSEEDRVTFVDNAMAGEHAVLLWQRNDNTYMVSNRSSIRPISVNGSPCGHALLTPGMQITLGTTTLEVAAEGYEGPAEAVATPCMVRVSDNLYLGEDVPEQEETVGTPAWLLQGKEGVSIAGANAAWDALAENPMTPERNSISGEENIPAVMRPPLTGDAIPQESVVEAAVEDIPEPEVQPELEVTEPAEPVLLGRLVVVKGANKGKSLEVYGDVTVGRSPECSMVLTDAQVSRTHCTITFEDGNSYISNVSNSNTTALGRAKINKKAELPKTADILLAGKVQLKWTANKQ